MEVSGFSFQYFFPYFHFPNMPSDQLWILFLQPWQFNSKFVFSLQFSILPSPRKLLRCSGEAESVQWCLLPWPVTTSIKCYKHHENRQHEDSKQAGRHHEDGNQAGTEGIMRIANRQASRHNEDSKQATAGMRMASRNHKEAKLGSLLQSKQSIQAIQVQVLLWICQ